MIRRFAPLLIVALLGCGGPEGNIEVGEAPEPRERPENGAMPVASSEPVTPEDTPESTNELLARAREPFLGDLDGIRERRIVRVLTSYSKSNFFHDGAAARGFEVELFRAWEKELNRGSSTYDRMRVVFVPTPFDRLLEDLRAGLGDVAAAGLTITAERKELVAFTEPYIPRVREVVVVHAEYAGPEDLEGLAGQRVMVRAGSSYVEHLGQVNRRLETSGAEAIDVLEADPRLVTEDLLEMVSAGVVEVTVADQHIAEAWAEVLPDLNVRDDLAIHEEGAIAWAVRGESPQLLASLNAFVRKNRKGSLLGNVLFKRYYAASSWIRNPVSDAERAKLNEHISLFQKYADEFGFDWMALAAQAYQESGLDQTKKSRAGAVGVMQILPSTAADKWVNVSDIHLLENNIHAGAKYLAFLRDRYFDDPAIEPAARVDFALAAYNAGPARVRGLRNEAAKRGLDPNRWFSNVEQIAAEEIGRETVDYVSNVNKYYVAYRLQYESALRRQAAKATLSAS